MKNLLAKTFLIVFITFSWNNVFSQSETDTVMNEQIVILKMKNGDKYKGSILKEDSNTIVLKTVNGEITLIAENVRSIKNYDDINFKDIHKSDYFLNSSAVPLPKGGAYVSLTNLTILSVNYGLTERWSVSGGFDFLSTTKSYPSWFLNPRYGIRLKPKIHFSTGLLVGKMTDFFDAGLLYGKLTLGQKDSNLSLGVGTGYLNGEYFGVAHGSLAFSHTFDSTLLGKRWGLASENYFFPNYNLPFEGALDNVFMGVHGVKIYLKKASLGLGVMTFPKIYQDGITRMYASFNKSL